MSLLILTFFLSRSETATQMRAAEEEAKANRRGVWADYEPQAVDATSVSHFKAVVIEVLSADSIVVVKKGAEFDEEIRLTFSSIRCGTLRTLISLSFY